jgi:hypothetical protein
MCEAQLLCLKYLADAQGQVLYQERFNQPDNHLQAARPPLVAHPLGAVERFRLVHRPAVVLAP